MKRWRAVAALFVAPAALWFLGASESDVQADPPVPTVVLLRPATSDAVTAEAMARVKGELKAAGFDVAILALSDDTRRDLETAGRDLKPIAAFAIFVTPSEAGTSIAEIWVSDRIRQKTVVENALLHETDRGRGSEILAVRAVELLKANLAAFWSPPPPTQAPQGERATPPPRPAMSVPDPGGGQRAPFASGLAAGVGAGVLDDFRANGVTWAPEATVAYGWPHGLSLRATVAGLAPTVVFASDHGRAAVDQQLAMFEAVKTWWPRAALVPFVFAGIGAQHLRVVGIGTPPYQGHNSDDWSLLTTLGVGLGIPVFSVISIVAQARGLAAWPSSIVQIAYVDAGRVGMPSLLVDAGLCAVLP